MVGIPLIGVLEPGVAAAAQRSRNRRVGVIGTEATIASGAYRKALRFQRRYERLIGKGFSPHEALRILDKKLAGQPKK